MDGRTDRHTDVRTHRRVEMRWTNLNLSAGSDSLLEGSEGLPTGLEGLLKGSEGLSEGPGGLPEGLRAC